MSIPRPFLLLAFALSACGAPGPRATVLQSDPTLISFRGTVALEDEMGERARAHCADFGRLAALRYLRNEGRTGVLFALYQCV
jgi:hypothetical protein